MNRTALIGHCASVSLPQACDAAQVAKAVPRVSRTCHFPVHNMATAERSGFKRLCGGWSTSCSNPLAILIRHSVTWQSAENNSDAPPPHQRQSVHPSVIGRLNSGEQSAAVRGANAPSGVQKRMRVLDHLPQARQQAREGSLWPGRTRCSARASGRCGRSSHSERGPPRLRRRRRGWRKSRTLDRRQ